MREEVKIIILDDKIIKNDELLVSFILVSYNSLIS